MDPRNGQLETLLDLEARHDDLLERLDALDKRVERVLADCLPEKTTGPEAFSSPVPAEGTPGVAWEKQSDEDTLSL